MSNLTHGIESSHQLWIDVMLRAEVNVEVCHVEEQDKSNERRQARKGRSKKSPIKRKKSKPIESDWETDSDVPVSGWEDVDELNESQYLPGDDPGLTLVRKRSADTFPDTKLGSQPVVKRRRTIVDKGD
jgi:hypothetical protein